MLKLALFNWAQGREESAGEFNQRLSRLIFRVAFSGSSLNAGHPLEDGERVEPMPYVPSHASASRWVCSTACGR